MTRLRFGVVGCGGISTLYQLPALRRCAAAKLVAVVDVDASWAAKVARRFDAAEAFDDCRRLVGAVDVALVATPNTTHADIVCTLLEQGIHVLCEKPMATTRADVDRMFAAATRGGTRLMAGHCLRFSPNLMLLRQVVLEGRLGRVTEIAAGIGGTYDQGSQRTDFRRQRRLAGGGVLIDLGVHVIDLAIWMLGKAPTSVRYEGRSAPGWEVEADAEVALEFPDAARAALACSFTQTLDNAFTVRGTEGWASASLYVPTELVFYSERARICQRAGVQRIVLADESMYDHQLEHFCAAIRSGAELVVRPEEVRASIDVIEECYASAGGIAA